MANEFCHGINPFKPNGISLLLSVEMHVVNFVSRVVGGILHFHSSFIGLLGGIFHFHSCLIENYHNVLFNLNEHEKCHPTSKQTMETWNGR